MIKRKIYIGLFLLVISFAPMLGISQENCTQKLRNARNYYQEGNLSLLPDLLTPCVKNGFSKEEKIEALRLITLAHLYSEDEEKAEQSYLSLLKIDPEFKPNESADPVELLLLDEKFDTDPKFFYGINAGAAYNLVEVIKPTRTINTSLNPGSYSFSTTIGAGIFFQFPINSLVSANAELYYMQRTLTLNKESDANSEQAFTQTISEQQKWLELPLLFNYQIIKQPFLLELTGGPAFHYLMNAQLNTEGSNLDPLNNRPITNSRNLFNLSVQLGVRGNVKSSGKLFFTFALLYQHRFMEEVQSESNFTQPQQDALFDAQYEDGQFKGHAVWIKLGVKIPYYKPQLK